MIIDEAHSSQSGDAARDMKKLLGQSTVETEEEYDWEDGLNEGDALNGQAKEFKYLRIHCHTQG